MISVKKSHIRYPRLGRGEGALSDVLWIWIVKICFHPFSIIFSSSISRVNFWPKAPTFGNKKNRFLKTGNNEHLWQTRWKIWDIISDIRIRSSRFCPLPENIFLNSCCSMVVECSLLVVFVLRHMALSFSLLKHTHSLNHLHSHTHTHSHTDTCWRGWRKQLIRLILLIVTEKIAARGRCWKYRNRERT